MLIDSIHLELLSCQTPYLAFRNNYREAMKTVFTTQFSKEDKFGYSREYEKNMQYMLAFYLCLQIRNDIIYECRDLGTNTSWTDIRLRYDLDNTEKKFECNSINLWDIYSLFGFTFNSDYTEVTI